MDLSVPSHETALCACARDTIHHKVRRLVGRYGFTDADRNDLEQDLTSHLLTVMVQFDPLKSQLQTFTSRIIDRKIANLIRARTTAMRDYRRITTVSDDEATLPQLPVQVADARADRVTEQRDLALDLREVLASLPDDLRDLCERLSTDSITHIARCRRVSRQRIHRDVHRLREIFARAGLRQYC